MRLLQSELMVAALTCRARGKYNTFATVYQPTLVAAGEQLRHMFAREPGNDLDSFITLLANDAATRRAAHGRDYCRVTATLFDEVMALPPEKLVAYAHERTFMSPAVPASCKSEAAIARR